jgi:DNA-3-methyladenine glycosylase I
VPNPEEAPGDGRNRCDWPATNDAQMVRYHDEVWGVPLHDDVGHFQMISLDVFQAGLSWSTILHKWDAFTKAFDGFDPEVVARYGDEKVQELLANAGIVRNRLKVAATISNAQRFLEVQRVFGSFDNYVWGFTGHKILRNSKGVTRDNVPATSPESDALSKDMKARGFKFAGSTCLYAYMQSAGMVNDHTDNCWRVTG